MLACWEIEELIEVMDENMVISADTMRCHTDAPELHLETTLADAVWNLYAAKYIDSLHIDDPKYQ